MQILCKYFHVRWIEWAEMLDCLNQLTWWLMNETRKWRECRCRRLDNFLPRPGDKKVKAPNSFSSHPTAPRKKKKSWSRWKWKFLAIEIGENVPKGHSFNTIKWNLFKILCSAFRFIKLIFVKLGQSTKVCVAWKLTPFSWKKFNSKIFVLWGHLSGLFITQIHLSLLSVLLFSQKNISSSAGTRSASEMNEKFKSHRGDLIIRKTGAGWWKSRSDGSPEWKWKSCSTGWFPNEIFIETRKRVAAVSRLFQNLKHLTGRHLLTRGLNRALTNTKKSGLRFSDVWLRQTIGLGIPVAHQVNRTSWLTLVLRRFADQLINRSTRT